MFPYFSLTQISIRSAEVSPIFDLKLFLLVYWSKKNNRSQKKAAYLHLLLNLVQGDPYFFTETVMLFNKSYDSRTYNPFVLALQNLHINCLFHLEEKSRS